MSNETPKIKWDVAFQETPFTPKYEGAFASNTTTVIAPFVISNEGMRALNKIGYDICHACDGDGWDANSGGGVYICGECMGKGITKLKVPGG